MAVSTAADFFDALRTSRLLDERRLDQAAPLVARFPDPRELASEMVRTAQLTQWQADQVLKGRAADIVLDQYVLLDLLGHGGMGEVFKARQVRMQRFVALKVIRKECLGSATAIGRFQREAMASARLSHPNIVTVHDANEVNGTPFLVMEFIEGTDLARLVKRSGTLMPETACDYIRQAALGLQHVHEQGLVHRDIKPANLMLTQLGIIKVMDLGLVRETWQESDGTSNDLTNTGAVMGTPAFLSPEQAMDAKRVDIRADIYSLGCTLYYLLTARPPFTGESVTDILLKHQMREPAPIEEARDDLPPGLGDVLRRMLAKKEEQRFQTPIEVADALEPYSQFTVPTVRRSGQDTKRIKRPTLPPIKGPTNQTLDDAAAPPTRVSEPLTLAPVKTIDEIHAPATSSGAPAPRPTLAEADLTPPWGHSFANTIGMNLAWVPAGTFVMGSPPDEKDRGDDEAQHQVEITRPFYLGTCQVTQEEYERITGHNPSYFSPESADRIVEGKDTRRMPVERVSWEEAIEFCRLLSDLPEEKALGRLYRLPTEAQWEFACRAAGAAPGPFHFGASLSAAQANFDGNQPYATGERGPNLGITVPVGSYPANALGLHDLHGNVWEWCADGYGPYPDKPSVDPIGPHGEERVVRGGSLYSSGAACRSAQRSKYARDYRDFDVGFRVVCMMGARASSETVAG